MMKHSPLTGWNRKRLRFWLLLFFMALAIPTAVLIYQAWSQLKWEAFHRHQLQAEELATRLDRDFARLVGAEEARAFTDYAFLNVAGDPAASFLQRSPLSGFPVKSAIPGLIGYFQVDPDGRLSTPLLPEDPQQSQAYGVTEQELRQRTALQERIQHILYQNRLVEAGKPSASVLKVAAAGARAKDKADADMNEGAAEDSRDVAASETTPSPAREVAAAPQSVLDNFELLEKQAKTQRQAGIGKGRVEELQLTPAFRQESETVAPAALSASSGIESVARKKRLEKSALPVQVQVERETDAPVVQAEDKLRVSIFESEINAFETGLLDSGQMVFFRKVWHDGQRYIQGALIDPEVMLNGVIAEAFRNADISRMSDLTVAYQGNVFSVFNGRQGPGYLTSAADLTGSLLYQAHLSPPLDGVQLIFSVNNLPVAAGGTVVIWVAALLLIVMCGGFTLMYRLGLGQINLARQQQDFVSAVSHELKTPLTSIRMYGEMLREGWAEESKKKTYYDFIYDESERLSRLIGNVLQLARMTRNDLRLELQRKSIHELLDGIRSKVSSQIERAGYRLNMECDQDARTKIIEIDVDCFSQIIINLVDNAIKFSRKAEARDIDIKCRARRDGRVEISVRDYGPGIAAGQMKKIFRLFYRPENEMTRETVGTGIGLALVRQLVQAMQGDIDVVNCDPGAEFRVSFPVVMDSGQ